MRGLVMRTNIFIFCLRLYFIPFRPIFRRNLTKFERNLWFSATPVEITKCINDFPHYVQKSQKYIIQQIQFKFKLLEPQLWVTLGQKHFQKKFSSDLGAAPISSHVQMNRKYWERGRVKIFRHIDHKTWKIDFMDTLIVSLSYQNFVKLCHSPTSLHSVTVHLLFVHEV